MLKTTVKLYGTSTISHVCVPKRDFGIWKPSATHFIPYGEHREPTTKANTRFEASAVQELTDSNASAVAEKLPVIAEETYKASWQRAFNISAEISECCIAVSKISGDKDTVMTAWKTHLDTIAPAARQELLALCECLENYDITDFEINLGITRGFDFYTGTVFQIELPDTHRPLCGGGRYDKLIESFGGTPTPGAGFAFQFDALVAAFVDTGKTTVNGRKDYFIAAGNTRTGYGSATPR